MDVRMECATLARELALLERVVARKVTIPVTANVLIRAEGAGLALAATDLDLALSGSCPATVARPGAVTLPALKLAEIARAVGEGELRLVADGAAVRLTCGSYASRLQTLPAADFPAMPAPPDGAVTQLLPRPALKGLVDKVRIAVGGPDARYFLNGALLTLEAGRMGLVATDSHRLARATAEAPGLAPDEPILVPAKALDQLAAILGDDAPADAPPVGFARGEAHLFFDVDGHRLSSRRLEGTFPAWERIIPKGNDQRATVGRAVLATALKRVSLLAVNGTRAVSLAFEAGAVTVKAQTADLGEADERVAAEYAGLPMTVSLQGAYLADFLGEADGEQVTVALKSPETQLLFLDGAASQYVVMPLRP